MKIDFTATTDGRLDKCILEALSDVAPTFEVSRSKLEHFIDTTGVFINGKLQKKNGTKIKVGDQISFVWTDQVSTSNPVSYEFPITILYEDDDLIAINKPAGLTVHPGAGNPDKTLLNALVSYYEKQNIDLPAQRCGIVHRLDKDTSGVLLVAKNDMSHASLQRQFAERKTKKEYRALVYLPERGSRELREHDEGVISAPLARSKINRLKMAVNEEGKEAITAWKIIERLHHAALISIDLKTGRTHQIRAHMESIKSGVIGDPLYNEWTHIPAALKRDVDFIGRQALHAYQITVEHPNTKKDVTFTAPLPDDFEKLILLFRS